MDREVLFLIIGLVGGALLSVPFGYFVTYTSSPLAERFRTWRTNRAQEKAKKTVLAAEKRILKLRSDLLEAEYLFNHPSAFIAHCINMGLAIGFAMVAFFLITALPAWFYTNFIAGIPGDFPGFYSYAYVTFFLFFPLGIVALFRSLKLDGVRHFHGYEELVQKQIAELQEVINRGNRQTDGDN